MESANAIAAVRRGGVGGLKGQLGILASRLGASHPLKLCDLCILDDQTAHQVAYWHVEHQWPGAWICLKHQQQLHFSLFKVNGEGRFHWCLPMEVPYAPGIAPQWLEESRDVVIRLTECACGMVALPVGFHFSPTRLAATYQNRLQKLGCHGPSGRLKSTETLNLLQAVCQPLSHVHGLSILSGAEVPLLNQFSRLIGDHRGVAHPLKHFVIVMALFNDWTTFMAAYETIDTKLECKKSGDDRVKPADLAPPLVNSKKIALVNAIKSGQSVTAAAQSFEVAVATAMAWSAEAGLQTPKRAKLLSPERRKAAIHMLRHGGSKVDVAAASCVSIQTITLLLRTEPGLRAAWNQFKFDRRQKESRASWTHMAQKLQPNSSHAVRKLLPAVFAWLYRNDRKWLEDFNEALPQPARSNNSRIRWDERDAHYSQAVDNAALDQHLAQPASRVRLADLCNRIPELKARLSNLNQLPLTHAAIARATRHRPAD